MFDYDPEWPQLFKEEAGRLASIWGDQCNAIHHVGSTSVPELRAKPIIDIMLVIKDISKVYDFDDGMKSLGYWCRGEDLSAGTPGRYYYSKDTKGLRTHQVHVVQEGHYEIEEMLNFRDYLRAHPEIANEYAELKTKLIEQNKTGILEYIQGKDKFIKACIAKASIWRNP